MGGMVELTTALNVAFALVAFFGGWFVKVLFSRINQLEQSDSKMTKAFEEMRAETMKAISDLRVELPTNYTSKQDFKTMGDNIFSAIRSLGADTRASLQRIEDKLAQKADKQ